MVHCGYDPSGALGTNYRSGDHWKNFKYNFWPRPPRCEDGHQVKAYNGASVGKGHLAEAKAALQDRLAAPGLTSAATPHASTYCGSNAPADSNASSTAATPPARGPGRQPTLKED
jgi:hypothetical protein